MHSSIPTPCPIKQELPAPADKRNGADSDKSTQQSMEDRGVLFLSGVVNYENCNAISKAIIAANYEPKTDFINLIVSSPGGDCDAGFSLIDVMEWSKVPIRTIALGEACSMGFLILMTGLKGHRQCSRNTVLLSHRFWGINAGNYSELIAHRTREDRLHTTMVEHYLRHTKIKSKKEIERLLLKDVDNWITPEEGIKYGVIDTILKPAEGFGV